MSSNGAGSTFSVIGSDVSITGNIDASADLHVDGTVEGDINCTSIVQGETSVISGAVVAESARLAGTVKGSISSVELIILQSARIEGDVHYEALTIEQGAHVEGRFSHSVQNKAKPASKAAKAPVQDESLVASS
jgi:cytoskeletal protein CcmA (bactofilin family)